MSNIWETFDLENNLIKEYKYWRVLIKSNHAKLGSCVAIAKRDVFPLSEITPEEMAEYALIAKEIEGTIKQSFNAYLVHHLALMFRDKHVHFHITPRYLRPVEFAGIVWEDDGQPDPLLQKRSDVSQLILSKIKAQLVANLPS
jgi:diadenosine tetraphosphate (Ap4A) HIT family hydrolase